MSSFLQSTLCMLPLVFKVSEIPITCYCISWKLLCKIFPGPFLFFCKFLSALDQFLILCISHCFVFNWAVIAFNLFVHLTWPSLLKWVPQERRYIFLFLFVLPEHSMWLSHRVCAQSTFKINWIDTLIYLFFDLFNRLAYWSLQNSPCS